MKIPKNKFKLWRKRPAHRFKIWLNYQLNKSSVREPVFVIAARRTGSNHLISCLNSIPHTTFLPEILNRDMAYGLPDKGVSKKEALNHIKHSIYSCQTRLCGAKLIRVQMDQHKIDVNDLRQLFPNAKFIVLYRRSLFDQYLSYKIAMLTNHWSWNPNFKLPEQVEIDREGYLEFTNAVRLFYRRIAGNTWLRTCGVFISYEELVENEQRVFDKKILPLLGVVHTHIQSKMVKQNTRKIEELVSNYDAVRDLLNDTLDLSFELSKLGTLKRQIIHQAFLVENKP